MKKIVSCIVIIAFLASCSKEKTGSMVVNGNIDGLKKGTVYLQKIKDTLLISVDSVQLNGNSNFVLVDEITSPEIYYITLDKKENEKIKQDLAATTGGSYDFAEQDKLANMQTEAEMLERKVQYERMRKNDIMKKMSMARMEVMRSRKNMGGVNVTTENTLAVDKQVHVLGYLKP